MNMLRLFLSSILLVIAIAASVVTTSAEGRQGTLTVLVRDTAGHRLAGISFLLFKDNDNDTRSQLGRYTTDQTGQAEIRELPWGMYILQFVGNAPDGRPIQAAARQNQGLLDDGQGISGGFGVRFAEEKRLEMYIILSDQAEAIPLFDMAAGPDAAPQPYDPAIANPQPTKVDVSTASPRSPATATGDQIVLAVIGVVVLIIAGLIGFGYYRSRVARAKDENEGRPHA